MGRQPGFGVGLVMLGCTLAGCSAASTSSGIDLLPGSAVNMTVVPQGTACYEWIRDGEAICNIAFRVSNSSDGPESVIGDLLVQTSAGKTYATTHEMPCDQCIDGVSDTFNPDESKLGFAQFLLPLGVSVERLFVDGGPSVDLNLRVEVTPEPTTDSYDPAADAPTSGGGASTSDAESKPDSNASVEDTENGGSGSSKGKSLFPGESTDESMGSEWESEGSTADEDSIFPAE